MTRAEKPVAGAGVIPTPGTNREEPIMSDTTTEVHVEARRTLLYCIAVGLALAVFGGIIAANQWPGTEAYTGAATGSAAGVAFGMLVGWTGGCFLFVGLVGLAVRLGTEAAS